VPESVEYGVTSFVYRAARPFHPCRLYDLVFKSDVLNTVVRSKGTIWLATPWGNSTAVMWSHAGKAFEFAPANTWDVLEEDADGAADGDEGGGSDEASGQQGAAGEHGGRRPDGHAGAAHPHSHVPAPGASSPQRGIELVLIGVHMNHHAVTTALDGCLLDEASTAAGPDAWAAQWEDPFDFAQAAQNREDEEGEESEDEEDGEGDNGDDTPGNGGGDDDTDSHSDA
jgi:G3E family GTPase